MKTWIIADNESTPTHRYSIVSDEAKHICDVTACNWKHGKQKHDSQALRNAQLIAAAPELLACAVALMAEMSSRFDYEDATVEEQETFDKMEAAIAKATGQPQPAEREQGA